MSIKATDLINTICAKIGIPREKSQQDQFLNKQELLQILAHIDKQEIHIGSLKREVDEHRTKQAQVEAFLSTMNNSLAEGAENERN